VWRPREVSRGLHSHASAPRPSVAGAVLAPFFFLTLNGYIPTPGWLHPGERWSYPHRASCLNHRSSLQALLALIVLEYGWHRRTESRMDPMRGSFPTMSDKLWSLACFVVWCSVPFVFFFPSFWSPACYHVSATWINLNWASRTARRGPRMGRLPRISFRGSRSWTSLFLIIEGDR
jgi:hypothetical protein